MAVKVEEAEMMWKEGKLEEVEAPVPHLFVLVSCSMFFALLTSETRPVCLLVVVVVESILIASCLL